MTHYKKSKPQTVYEYIQSLPPNKLKVILEELILHTDEEPCKLITSQYVYDEESQVFIPGIPYTNDPVKDWLSSPITDLTPNDPIS